MKKILSSLGLLSLLALLLFFLTPGNGQSAKELPDQEQSDENSVRPIPAARAKVFVKEQSFRFPGRVKAARRAELSFQIAGQINQLNILEGQQVKKGDLLASLDQKSYLYALKAANAKFLGAEQDFNRARQLYQEKVISKAEFDAAQSAHDIAQAELEMKKKELSDTRLLAPFDGLVAKRYAEPKEHVNNGQPVLLLQDVSRIEVEVQLPEQLVAQGGTDIIGQLQVRFDAAPEQTFAADAMELSLESSQDTRTYSLVIRLPSPADMHILPGMTATVSGTIKEPGQERVADQPAVLVPVEAVTFTPDARPYVWIINEQTQKAEKRMVKVGSMHGNAIEVTGGLHANEAVATAGLNSLDEQQPVRPMRPDREGLEG